MAAAAAVLPYASHTAAEVAVLIAARIHPMATARPHVQGIYGGRAGGSGRQSGPVFRKAE